MAERLRSPMLVANAWHARADAASSLVVAAGIGGGLLGYKFLDLLAATIVGFMIVRMGFKFACEALRELIDTGLDEEEVAPSADPADTPGVHRPARTAHPAHGAPGAGGCPCPGRPAHQRFGRPPHRRHARQRVLEAHARSARRAGPCRCRRRFRADPPRRPSARPRRAAWTICASCWVPKCPRRSGRCCTTSATGSRPRFSCRQAYCLDEAPPGRTGNAHSRLLSEPPLFPRHLHQLPDCTKIVHSWTTMHQRGAHQPGPCGIRSLWHNDVFCRKALAQVCYPARCRFFPFRFNPLGENDVPARRTQNGQRERSQVRRFPLHRYPRQGTARLRAGQAFDQDKFESATPSTAPRSPAGKASRLPTCC